MASILSPFKKKDIAKEMRKKSIFQEVCSFLYRKANEVFIQRIPSEDIRDMPPSFMYPIGSVAFLILLAIFLVVFTLSYQAQIGTEFLSPLSGTTTDASPYCETISVSNSGTLRATQSGYWEGAAGFQYSEASYIATVTNWQVTPEEYADALNLLYFSIAAVGNITKENDLGYNLVFWFSFTARPELENTAQRFNLIGDPLVVFNRQYVQGALSTVGGDCNLTSNALFNNAKGELQMEYNYDLFMANPICESTGNPKDLGYLTNINSNLYSIKFDVRSLVTALAVNLKIAYLSDLVEITAYQESYSYQGMILNISRYYDPKYPSMTPITCITNPDQQQCVLIIGRATYALPVFNHIGNNTDYPMKCICSDYNETILSDRYFSCNLFRLLAGFIYYPISGPDGVIELMIQLNFNYQELNNNAFQPQFIASYWGQGSSYYDSMFTSPSYRDSIYKFCNISIGYCSILTFSLFDENYDWSISSYYFQLLTGACQDKISTTYDKWSNLITTPFMPLVQSYQKCHYFPSTVFVNQLGVSVGTLSAIAPFVVIAFLQIVIFIQVCSGKKIPVAYRKFERDVALKAFTTSLLLTRDRMAYQKDDESPQPPNVMKEIVEVLERDAVLFNDPYQLKEEIDELTVQWKEIQRQQFQQMNPLQSPLLVTKNNNKKNNKTSIRILNTGRYYPRQSKYLPKNYQNKDQIIQWLQHLIQQFEEYTNQSDAIPTASSSSTNSSQDDQSNNQGEGRIWFIINETLCLKQIPAGFIHDDREFRRSFFPLMITLLSYHISVITGINHDQYQRKDELLDQIQQLYRHQYAYYLGSEVFTLDEMIQVYEDFSLYLAEDEEQIDNYISKSLLPSNQVIPKNEN